MLAGKDQRVTYLKDQQMGHHRFLNKVSLKWINWIELESYIKFQRSPSKNSEGTNKFH
jgi:hypothetical protein